MVDGVCVFYDDVYGGWKVEYYVVFVFMVIGYIKVWGSLLGGCVERREG